MKAWILTLLFGICLMPVTVFSQYQYLGTFQSDGTPDYLIGRDSVPEDLLADIQASLPESKPVPIYNPHLISAGYDTDIQLNAEADVFVTFVDEGAGYKNVLGFYTYDLAAPYTAAPPKEEVTIIFPNVSKLYSGGGLQTGDRVKLGRFPANTGIGWVLLANGYTAGGVTDGNWVLYSNPDFNPEAQSSDRYHNVLLNSEDYDLIVLGFEDIRRDYASCDQDFNDALFYVTANPIQALGRSNLASIVKSEEVSSGNDGGLESNGDLASAIAKRNYQRNSQGGGLPNQMAYQSPFNAISSAARRVGANLADYFPVTGAEGDEVPYVSSPTDLLSLTNATEVFSADYYKGEARVAVALATKTEGSVYNHNKHICDRLNGSKLLDARVITLKGFELIYVKIRRANGHVEYASWLSVRDAGEAYEAYSLWNIADYPAGDYMNYQAWGSSPSQVFSILAQLIDNLNAGKQVINGNVEPAVPGLYVMDGHYRNGSATLRIANSQRLSEAVLNYSYRATENGEEISTSVPVVLSGETEQVVTIPVGYIFDAGVSLASVGGVSDALYLADGAWGVDYNAQSGALESFDIAEEDRQWQDESTYFIERSVSISGQTSDVVNVYRNILAGQRTLSIEEYQSIAFYLSSSQSVQVSLIEHGLEDWNDRLVYEVAATGQSVKHVGIAISQFQRPSGKDLKMGEIQAVLFSFINSTGGMEYFSFTVSEVSFGGEVVLATYQPQTIKAAPVLFPNPSKGQVEIKWEKTPRVVYLHDAFGRLVHSVSPTDHTMRFSLSAGVYYVTVCASDGTRAHAQLIVE